MNYETTPNQPITIEKPADLPGAPMSSLLGYDHPCLECDYNLRGLAIGASCPECNSPVTDSLKKRLLRYADPQYIRKLRSGARCITICAILPLVGFCVMIPLSIVTAASGFANAPITTTTTSSGFTSTSTFASTTSSAIVPAIVQTVFSIAVWSLFAFGWYRLTTQDPNRSAATSNTSSGMACRGLAIATSSILIVAALFGFAGSVILGQLSANAAPSAASMAVPGAIIAISGFSSLIAYLLLIVQFVFGIKQVKRLTPRIPAGGLTKYAAFVFWFTLSTIGAYLLMVALIFVLVGAAFIPGSGASPMSGLGGVALILMIMFGFIASIAIIASYAMYIGLFARLWSQLSKTCQLNPA